MDWIPWRVSWRVSPTRLGNSEPWEKIPYKMRTEWVTTKMIKIGVRIWTDSLIPRRLSATRINKKRMVAMNL
jgi:hypothetical protein